MDKSEFLAQVISQHIDELYRYAFFRTGSQEVSEDMLQDCFLRFMDGRQDVFAITNIRAYLFRMLSNRCTDHMKNLNKNTRVEIDHVVIPAEEEAVSSEEEDFARIRLLMKEIPPEQQEVINMKTMNNLSFAEIADILDLPVTTVKSRFRYGIDKLRDKSKA